MRVEEVRVERMRVEEVRVEEVRMERMRVEEVRMERMRVEEVRMERMRVEEVRVKEVRMESMRMESMRVEGMRVEEVRVESVRMENMRVEEDPDQVSQTLQVCGACRGCLTSSQLSASSGPRGPHCRPCVELENRGRQRRNLTPYRSILIRLRSQEDRDHPQNNIPYLLEEEDMHYLVEEVWGGRSAVSGVAGPRGLVMGLWKPRQAWSPWNCLLLTREENLAHLLVPDPQQPPRHGNLHPTLDDQLVTKPLCHGNLHPTLDDQLVTKPLAMATCTPPSTTNW
ncbi:hypothetical protein CRUP_008086 [Coryphaenoides rupestris]|nr:hypothetical protein CRUP_008086 [Coryphaenoides rupestris]